MSLVRMSLYGGLMAFAVAILRVLLKRVVPKRTFVVLWLIVAARLLVPFEPFFAVKVRVPAEERETAAYTYVSEMAPAPVQTAKIIEAVKAEPLPEPQKRADVPLIVWSAGTALCAGIFAALYIIGRRKFRYAVTVDNDAAALWLRGHKLRRKISLKELEKIGTPMTYGVARPVILTPTEFPWQDAGSVKFALEHEYVHIRRFDAAKKLVFAAALIVHWFNPAVWLMYILSNRDIEMACDEAVLRRFGAGERAAYARTLIALEERRSAIYPAVGFGKKPMEERITEIMKMKKRSVWSIILALVLVAALTACAVARAETVREEAEDKPVPVEEIAEDKENDESAGRLQNELEQHIEQLEAAEKEQETAVKSTGTFVLPTADTGYIASSFGVRIHPVSGEEKAHNGIDIGGLGYGADVYASDGGTVTVSEFDDKYGEYVIIVHGNGYETLYASMQERIVSVGDSVDQGDVIGYVGSTGASNGPHLHFEVHCNGEAVDPLAFVPYGNIGQLQAEMEKLREQVEAAETDIHRKRMLADAAANEGKTVIYYDGEETPQILFAGETEPVRAIKCVPRVAEEFMERFDETHGHEPGINYGFYFDEGKWFCDKVSADGKRYASPDGGTTWYEFDFTTSSVLVNGEWTYIFDLIGSGFVFDYYYDIAVPSRAVRLYSDEVMIDSICYYD